MLISHPRAWFLCAYSEPTEHNSFLWQPTVERVLQIGQIALIIKRKEVPIILCVPLVIPNGARYVSTSYYFRCSRPKLRSVESNSFVENAVCYKGKGVFFLLEQQPDRNTNYTKFVVSGRLFSTWKLFRVLARCIDSQPSKFSVLGWTTSFLQLVQEHSFRHVCRVCTCLACCDVKTTVRVVKCVWWNAI